MKKIAFLHPGQASQKVGMGKNLISFYPAAKDIFDEANKTLDFDIKRICLEAPEKELIKTSNLQPALLTINWIITKLIKEKGINPQAVAGHSLGEYNALLTAKAFDFPTALKIVKKRANLMERAGKNNKGSMAAVIGLDTEKIIDICHKTTGVKVVNFNCPGQVVISGEREKVLKVVEKIKKIGAKKVVLLPVSGAFHSPLMKDVAKKFSLFLEKFTFSQPICPVVSNTTGELAISKSKIKNNLKLQMDHPVLWEKSMKSLINEGFDLFVEVGPGKILQGLMKRINKKIIIMGINDQESVTKLISLIS